MKIYALYVEVKHEGYTVEVVSDSLERLNTYYEQLNTSWPLLSKEDTEIEYGNLPDVFYTIDELEVI